MKDICQKIYEDHYAAPDFNHMTPPILILKLIEGEKLDDLLPKLSNGAKMAILGVLDEYENKFKTTVKEVQTKLFPHN
jgi:hypothetical protein